MVRNVIKSDFWLSKIATAGHLKKKAAESHFRNQSSLVDTNNEPICN